MERPRDSKWWVPRSPELYCKANKTTAFQTTVALAEFQASEEKSTDIELKIDYLDQVVKMSKRFKAYLSTMPDGNVAKKALRYGKRNDEFDSS
jgi:hypothetical protein